MCARHGHGARACADVRALTAQSFVSKQTCTLSVHADAARTVCVMLASGDGDGSGGGEAVEGPRQIGGRIAYRDLPEGLLAEGREAAVRVVFAVRADGKAEDCEIDRSSGNSTIDALTCRLIEQRFRFRPALDRRGRPVRSYVQETHTWYASPE